jgi:hypothetical protein
MLDMRGENITIALDDFLRQKYKTHLDTLIRELDWDPPRGIYGRPADITHPYLFFYQFFLVHVRLLVSPQEYLQ